MRDIDEHLKPPEEEEDFGLSSDSFSLSNENAGSCLNLDVSRNLKSKAVDSGFSDMVLKRVNLSIAPKKKESSDKISYAHSISGIEEFESNTIASSANLDWYKFDISTLPRLIRPIAQKH